MSRRASELLRLWLFAVAAFACRLPLARAHVRVVKLPVKSFATAVAFTKDGYAWIGTRAGLLRWDGVKLAPASTAGLPASQITALLSHNDTLWIGTSDLGLWRANHGQATRVKLPGLESQVVVALAQDGTGAIWAATDHTVIQLRDGGAKPCRLPPDAMTRVSGLVQSATGSLLVLTNKGSFRVGDTGLVRMTGATWLQNLAPSFVAAACAHSPKWCHMQLHDLHRGPYGDAVGGVHGLLIMRNQKPHFISGQQGLPDDEVLRLAGNQEGGLLVATRGGSVAYIHHPLIETVGSREGLGGNTAFGVAAAPDGALWAATNDGVARLEPPNQPKLFVRGKELSFDVPLSVFAHSSGRVWAATMAGPLFHIDGDGARTLPLPDPTPGAWATAFFETPTGALYIATSSGGLFETKAGNTNVLIEPLCRGMSTAERAPCRNAFRTIEPRARGGLWMGTYGEGLYVFDHNELQRPSPEEGALPTQGLVSALLEEEDATLWLAVGPVVQVHRKGRVVMIHPGREGYTHVGALLPDRLGNVWTGSASGLVRIDRRSLEEVFAAGGGRLSDVGRFDAEDGMASELVMSSFWGSGAASKLGDLAFATAAGVVLLHEPERWPPAPPPALELRIEDTPGVAARAHDLPASTRRVLVDWSAPAIEAPHRLRLRHRWREGGKWSAPISTRNFAVDVPGSGTHILQAEVFVVDRPSVATAALLQLKVAPPWYRSTAFLASLPLFLLAGVGTIFALRLHQQRQSFAMVLKERSRIAHDLHDNLAQVLSALGLELDVIERAAQAGKPDLSERFKHARSVLAHGRRAARSVISNLRAAGSSANLVEVLKDMTKVYSGITVEVNGDGAPRKLGIDVEHEVLSIAGQALSNAIEHGRANRVIIDVAYGPGRFELWVRDNGRGMSAENQPGLGHFGLVGMRERAERAGGVLFVESVPEVGTEVGIVIEKTKKNRPKS